MHIIPIEALFKMKTMVKSIPHLIFLCLIAPPLFQAPFFFNSCQYEKALGGLVNYKLNMSQQCDTAAKNIMQFNQKERGSIRRVARALAVLCCFTLGSSTCCLTTELEYTAGGEGKGHCFQRLKLHWPPDSSSSDLACSSIRAFEQAVLSAWNASIGSWHGSLPYFLDY